MDTPAFGRHPPFVLPGMGSVSDAKNRKAQTFPVVPGQWPTGIVSPYDSKALLPLGPSVY